MTLRIGDVAPDFTAESTEGTIHFHEWIGDQWAVHCLTRRSHRVRFCPLSGHAVCA